MQQCSSLQQYYAGHCGSLLVPTISLLDHVILGYRGQPAAIWSSSCFLIIHGLTPCDNEGLARPHNWFSGWCFILAVVASCLDWPSKINEGEIKEILEDILFTYLRVSGNFIRLSRIFMSFMSIRKTCSSGSMCQAM